MALTHALPTNNYGNPKFIVATSAANGTHTTLASAMADAVSGDTIALRDSVTENVTITPGVNIVALNGGSTLNSPSITGTLTMTGAGTSILNGLTLITNSGALIAVTGSAASILNLNNCYLNCTNNTGITFSSSSSSARLAMKYCSGDLGTTGISLFSHSSAGTLSFYHCDFSNSGGSTTASTVSAGIFASRKSTFTFAITSSSTSSFLAEFSVFFNTNATALTLGGSGAHTISFCSITGGTGSAISIGSTVNLKNCNISSSNTNAITGAGTINFSDLIFEDTSSVINTTTQNTNYVNLGKYKASGQPAFGAFIGSNDSNVTGDGTNYTIGTNVAWTEIFDIGNNFNTNGTFTAPVTGKYYFSAFVRMEALTAAMTFGQISFVTTSKTYFANLVNPAACRTVAFAGNIYSFNIAVLANMTAGDTCILNIQISGGTKVAQVNGDGGTTVFQGWQIA